MLLKENNGNKHIKKTLHCTALAGEFSLKLSNRLISAALCAMHYTECLLIFMLILSTH